MSDRHYHFPDRLHDVAETSGINDIAIKIYDGEEESLKGEPGYSPYPWCITRPDETDHDIALFRASPEHAELEDNEKNETLKALDLNEQDSWAILGSGETRNDDTLFELPRYVTRIACEDEDRLTLSGIGGWGYLDFEPRIFDAYKLHGFEDRLAFMQFAGAWLCKVAMSDRKGPNIDLDAIEDPGLRRVIEIGGDIHGDFRMSEKLLPVHGAITPYGRKTEFSPLETTATVAGYHSIEKAILTAVCAYVIDSDQLNPAEKQKLFEIILSEKNLEPTPQKGVSFYGDFGDDYDDSEMVKIDLDGCRLRAQRGQSYCAFMVQPGNEQALLVVSKTDAGDLELKNNYQKRGITFRPNEIPEVLSLFVSIGDSESRTSKSSVLHALLCAQEELQSGSEPGHVIFKD